MYPQGCGGSSPFFGTKHKDNLRSKSRAVEAALRVAACLRGRRGYFTVTETGAEVEAVSAELPEYLAVMA
jgi:hypothetical protein